MGPSAVGLKALRWAYRGVSAGRKMLSGEPASKDSGKRARREVGSELLKRARKGLYAGRKLLSGNKVSEDGGNRSRRKWKPNVGRNSLYSEILGRKVFLRCTAHALRCIDKLGGLDQYILKTPEKELNSDVGMRLKKMMLDAQMVPPPVPGVRRRQKVAGT
mmetsp:Transcript_14626/g.44189  ORF Transcript_14626/g.44189 Transcript_14626/m.44189 type:complete len:161 (-) Transcript_14626:972-1454(-)|eukprot:CAMPEP_0206149086 /NCGR_PEP_ID=MMETSP1473-20131121/37596_1 /ASSEMBLY_ACC=CAM_ASM_001109 /TAXON_ID=1461547 /ORGANISM="Stichococcus sp, Strain RCC1054" /LENGTH=160 /DNA_ID=CAMNT_0053546529 /DNA_START=863 /DNA_END=1345 /DNA_ORIENTATION=-